MNLIEKTKGPCIILAGAGTGKTFTIVEKVKYLITNKIYSPEKIVCITFSNESANSLYSRIKPLTSDKEPIVKTFHAFSADLLRTYSEKINLKKDFSVLTPNDAKILLHKYFRISSSNCHKYIETISTAKDLGISVNQIQEYLSKKISKENLDENQIQEKLHEIHLDLQSLNFEVDKEKRKQFSEKIKHFTTLKELKNFISSWKAYEKIKKRSNYQDYSDLNLNALELLTKNPEIADKFDYIIVDEFQDTNKIQLEFLFQLAKKRNITVVGDLNQSIYRFRGAYNENLNLFKNFFKITNQEVFALDKSYRSSNNILKIAHKLISNNYSFPNECFEVFNVDNREGDKIEVYELKNAKEEARKIVEIIEEQIKKGKRYENICVMFRTHQQGQLIKNYLEYKSIPFTSVTREPLLKQKNIRTIVNLLKVLLLLKEQRKGGEQAWWDLLYQHNFPQQDLMELGKFIKKNKQNECLSNLLINKLQSINLSAQGKILVSSLILKINKLLPLTNKKITEFLKDVYSNLGFEDGNRKEIMDLNKFYDLALNQIPIHYGDFANFVNYIEIMESLGINIGSSETCNSGVRLMTSHSTKGLEFDIVIITNLAQKRFPIERINLNKLLPLEIHPELKNLQEISVEDMEKEIKEYTYRHQILEERRLCYVSFTRAKEKLFLTYSREYGSKKAQPSQFLQEIDYKNNPSVNFFIDKDEKYQEPKLKNSRSNNFNEKSEQKPKLRTLSPSALNLFCKCQKQFEYRYIYNMPDPKPIAWEEMKLGSFVHLVLEHGVRYNLKSEKEFIDLAKTLVREEDWKDVDIDEVIYLVKVFYQRNKNKFNKNSKTEKQLKTKIGGINFFGVADRIDFSSEGIEIIDYKTGQSNVQASNRNFQLGYYAIAATSLGKIHKLTLDLLRHDEPLEFEVDEKGIARSGQIWFDLNKVEQEILETANQIKNAIANGFTPCSRDKNCSFCEEWIYRD
ncbi:MAG: ATP-dependent DNA helicase [Nanoarchaeota archaeon]|nr:ATP-dependent DNA helicase [Nanoarchaeota archaeon]